MWFLKHGISASPFDSRCFFSFTLYPCGLVTAAVVKVNEMDRIYAMQAVVDMVCVVLTYSAPSILQNCTVLSSPSNFLIVALW